MINIDNLSNEIEQKSFYKANLSSNNNWFYMSILFQALNIVICFFGIYLFLNKVLDEFIFKEYIIGLISFSVLFIWEKLKRQVIRKVNLNFLRAKKKYNNEQLSGLLLMGFLIVCNSLIAIQGGIELSDKGEKIEVVSDSLITQKRDLITNNSNLEITKLENRINYIYENALDRRRRTRALTDEEKIEVATWQNDIKNIKIETSKNISNIEKRYEEKHNEKRDNNNNTVLIFIISSLLFETFIFIGVSYCAYYDFKSYFEIIETDNYKNKKLYNFLLNLFFKNGTLKVDDYTPSEKTFKEIIKIKDKNVTDKNVKEFIAILLHLDIIIAKNTRRFFNKDYNEANNILKEYLEK